MVIEFISLGIGGFFGAFAGSYFGLVAYNWLSDLRMKREMHRLSVTFQSSTTTASHLSNFPPVDRSGKRALHDEYFKGD